MAQQPKKPVLPSIDDDLAAAPRKRVDLKAIRPAAIVDDDTVIENSRRIGEEWGASTSLPTGSEEKAAPSEDLQPPSPATPIASLRIEVPIYLDDELRLKAATAGVTKQFLVMQALAAAGYTIRPEDLVADRRKSRRLKT